jgi:hypothetical protein
MRWRRKRKEEQTFAHGDYRTTVRFLWWPLTLKGQTRWLERAEIREIYETEICMRRGYPRERPAWTPCRWLNW